MADSPSKNGNKKPAPQRSLSRRVSFNEATLAKPQHRSFDTAEDCDTEAQQRSQPGPGCVSIFNSCCVWVSFLIGVLLLLVLLAGAVYFSFLQSSLPEVRLHRLDVNWLNVTDTNSDALLSSDFEVFLNVTNKNSRIELSYSPMTATIMSEGINLGTVTVPKLHQGAQSASDIKVRTSVNRLPVEKAAGSDLASNSNFHLMVISVNLRGHIDFSMNGNRLNGFPFKISCNDIDQSEIDNGHAPKCSAQMSPI